MAATPEHAARVLGLDIHAGVEDVRRARRELAMKYHPDCRPDVATSTRHMARVNAAADKLIEYILSKTKKVTENRQPSYTDFAERRKINIPVRGGSRRTDHTNQTAPDAKPSQPSVSVPVQRSVTRQVAVAVDPTPSAPLRSSQDQELSRMAAEAYTTVLQQIAGTDTGPTVDARALRFNN